MTVEFGQGFESGPTASATKCLVGRSVSEAFRFRPCLALKTEFSAGVVDKVEASTTGLICASPVSLLIPLLVQAVSVAIVPRSSSPTRDKCDSGSHSLVVESQHYICPQHVACYPNQLCDACIVVSRPVGSHERREPTRQFT